MIIRLVAAIGLLLLPGQPVAAQACDGGSLLSLRIEAEHGEASELYPDGASGEEVALRTGTVLDLCHIESVEVRREDSFGYSVVVAVLAADGRDRLRQATAESLGRRIASVIDGEVVYMATVRGEVTGTPWIPIFRTDSAEEAADVASRLNELARP